MLWQMNLIYIYKTCLPKAKEYTFFLGEHGKSSTIKHLKFFKNVNRHNRAIQNRGSWMAEQVRLINKVHVTYVALWEPENFLHTLSYYVVQKNSVRWIHVTDEKSKVLREIRWIAQARKASTLHMRCRSHKNVLRIKLIRTLT